MQMHQIRYFLAVCDTLNFTRAARNCNVTQPSLTRAIQHLEKEYGGYLFYRERANIQLTELGRTIEPYLRSMIEQAQTSKLQARALAARSHAELSLAIMCTIAPRLLIQLFARLAGLQPDFRLKLVDGAAHAVEERLIGAQTDAAIYCRPDREPNPRLNYLPLFREQMMIVLPAGHRLAGRKTVEIRDLAGEPYVQRIFCEFNDMVDSIFEQRGVDCETVYRSDRDDWVLAMIASGFGFGFFPDHSIDQAGVVAIPLVDPEFWREVNLTTVKGRPHSPAVGALVREAMRATWLDGPPLAVRRHPPAETD
jgi:LysR family hydrogen peroxide-inducible transcriptional activator